MAIILTENAAKQIEKFREDNQMGETQFLRIGVAGGGCSGFNYTLNFDDSYDEAADSKYEQHGVTVVVRRRTSTGRTQLKPVLEVE
ncbi:MAG: iron-sulfur cluster assembly accessory protein [Planctomycetota bacterium]